MDKKAGETHPISSPSLSRLFTLRSTSVAYISSEKAGGGLLLSRNVPGRGLQMLFPFIFPFRIIISGMYEDLSFLCHIESYSMSYRNGFYTILKKFLNI